MATVSGTVTNIMSRKVSTKFGEKPVYDIEIDGNKYSWGFKTPQKDFPVGTAVVGEAIETKYGWSLDEKAGGSLRKAGTGSTTDVPSHSSPPKPSSPSYGSREVGFPLPATSSQISIVRQNSLTNARELVTKLDGDLVSKACGKDDPANLVAQDYVDLILVVARQFSDYTSGRDITDKIEKMALAAKVGTDE